MNYLKEENFNALQGMDLQGAILSSTQAKPCLHIEYSNNKYRATIGALEVQAGKRVFVPAITNRHQWIQSRSSIKSMPAGITECLDQCFIEMDLEDLPYPKVLELTKNSEHLPFILEIGEDVFTSAATQAELSQELIIPTKVKATLYPYQKQGVSWMWSVIQKLGGVILADEMGLGKTLQVITLICKLPDKKGSPVLIACPSSLLVNWQREIHKFAPTVSCMIHQGSDRARIYKDLQKPEIVITTYDTLHNDMLLLEDVQWSMLVCDEAQALKNPDSTKRASISTLPRRWTIMMTGTPIENSLLDLWSIVDMAIPGSLGTKDDFQIAYPDNKHGAEKLTKVAGPIVLKRLVKDVAKDLPERSNIELPMQMDEQLTTEYNRIKNETVEKYGRAGELVATGQMVLFCAHPWLQAKDPDNPWEGDIEINTSSTMPLMTPKMEVLIGLLNESFRNGKKVLVFAAFNKCKELIELASKESSLPEAYWNQINGSTPTLDRQTIIDDFTKYDGAGVLVLNPRAAGAGLNITAATIVIHFTQYWNPAIEAQASKRAHRNGQKQHVTVYYLIYKDSVEEDMLAKVEWKADLAQRAIIPQQLS